ncbi:flagellar basal body P-ring formation protein FlgA [Citrobacter sedlakii]|uniref:Flagella basal body P-ring formation protein FlgA n=1 Tax=Citrobacter sedlakii TaxID=67826 RepID=A0ABS0ZRS6_9ENTR|nr:MULTISPECIES: flagellar basal body P-ring formation chaperone FlgA [Citrobacter]MBJ8381527.1 flagellar basal body P-ring formation protein FlgA [Citrobacter sedlakii]MBM9568407.1 flagellar basal body P-ring formation protein FlgA [Citrobacter sedlakii]MCZ4674260.1 flagellar basal body P-ring formation chaperone FlgA [Citrobacter sedlakii]MDR5004315.1 flagellar basal body P-ring formation chaperone FlgA [Citrobacter sedlakii]MEB0950543.1 flagellar basal body P-ring formation chaperone FlgA [
MIYNRFSHFQSPEVKRCFRYGVFSFLLAFAVTASAATPEKKTNARKQIYVATQLHAAKMIYHEAKRRQWPDYQAEMNLFIPSEASHLVVCAQEPTVTLPEGERIDLNRLRVDVRCDAPQRWDVAVTVKPDIYLPVVVAQNTLDRGHLLSPDDITIKKLNISGLRGNYLTNPDEVMGLTVKRRIRDRQAIALTQLEAPVLVERGQRVVMIAEQGGVEARTVGEAMKKGRKGEIIKVKNESSERVVSAIVADSGVVKMVYAGGR